MIIGKQEDVTTAVLGELERAPDARFKEIMGSLVRHLHAFARETRLTETEYQRAIGYVVALGKQSSDSHNEGVLVAGSLGLSALVCLLNNGNNGQAETNANMLGPFWRPGSPQMKNGASIVRSPTPGATVFVKGQFRDRAGKPVVGAKVDIWHSSTEGFYENQDPEQADMNLRGTFTTDADGIIRFRSIKPAGYPIPIDGVVGELLRAQGRHNMRPSHLHFLAYREGFKTLISQVYDSTDKFIASDVQFGVTRALIGEYVPQSGPAPDADVKGTWYSLDYSFTMDAGKMELPRPPISGKASGERPAIPRLA
jgi:hydroxyquinol 1,2-dioxygenase